MTVLLLKIARERWELYNEPPDDDVTAPGPDAGRFRHWAHMAAVRWHELVERARRGEGTAWFTRQRDRIVTRLADAIAGERMLWALGNAGDATLLFPSTISASEAGELRNRILASARRRHAWWFAFDGLVFVISGLLAIVPGPNAIAYYLAFRLIGHGQSWLGAGRAVRQVRWTMTADDALAELASLADLSHDARRARVDAIARRLHLRRLTAFFERVAA